MAAGQHNGGTTFKNPDPIGPFRYGDTSHALSDGLDPPKIRGNGGLRHHRTTGRGYGRGCTSLSDDTGEPSVRGGDSQSCHDEIVSSKKRLYPDWRALGSIIGVWSVQLIRAYPVVEGGVVLLR